MKEAPHIETFWILITYVVTKDYNSNHEHDRLILKETEELWQK